LRAEKCRCDFTWEAIIHTISEDKQLTLNLLKEKNRTWGGRNMTELEAAGPFCLDAENIKLPKMAVQTLVYFPFVCQMRKCTKDVVCPQVLPC